MNVKSYKIVFILFLLLFSISGCGKNGNNKEIKVAYFPNITHAQALVMKSKEMFEEKLEKKYKITWKAFNAGPAEIESLFAGEIDLGYIGPVPAINAYVKSKGDLNIIAGATNAGAVLVSRKDLKIKEISELSNKKVAIPQLGNTQHLLLLKLLAENGLKTKTEGGTVDVVAVSNADIKSLMDKGELDAALVPEPWGSILENDIKANIVMDYNELWKNGDYSTAVVIVSKDFLENKPDIVEKFLEAHKEATLFINNNQEEAKRMVNEEIQNVTSKPIDVNILDTAFSRLVVSEQIPKESIFEYADINLQENFIDTLPDENLINSSILEKLQ